MSNEIDADYSQQYLLPPSVEDWVPADHPARFVRDFVDQLDLKQLGFKSRKSGVGRPNYGPRLLLKVWLYGYFMRVRTSRRLEQMCRDHMPFIWLTGRHTPDHNTLWRFFKKNEKALAKLHKQTIKVALRCDLVGFVLHAVDGTKMGAKSSIRSCLKRGELEKAQRHIEEHIEDLFATIHQEELEDLTISDNLPDEIVDAAERLEKIRGLLSEMEAVDRENLNPNEPEGRIIGKKSVFGYNAQAVVDEKSGLVVAQDLVNDESDSEQLVRMIEKVEDSIGVCAEETVADGGYASEEELAKAEDQGYAVIVNLPEPNRTTKDHDLSAQHFKYDSEKDIVLCPEQPIELSFERAKERKGKKIRVYRCHNRECPLAKVCSRDKRGRSIEIGAHRAALDRQREKQLDSEVRHNLRQRGRIVEPLFGHTKERFGFRRFTMLGLMACRAQWGVMTAVRNLEILYRHGALDHGLARA